MSAKKHIFAVDSHTSGEPTRIVVGGIRPIPGSTMAEKKDYLSLNLDDIRTMLMHEPRGHKDMFGSIILEPTDKRADLGIIFMDSGGYLNMCGHGSIGAATVAVEIGLVNIVEPKTEITFDTPAGLIKATVNVQDGKATGVTIQNVPVFLYREGVKINIPGKAAVPIDIAFGGNFFALVDAACLGIEVVPENIKELVDLGKYIKSEVNKVVKVHHPELPHLNSVDLVEIYGPPTRPEAHARNIVIFGNGQFDRSPCGTGTTAKMAALFFKNQLELGKEFIHESIIGTTFKGKVISQTTVGNIPAVITELTGRAFITGYQHIVSDPTDQVCNGFLIG